MLAREIELTRRKPSNRRYIRMLTFAGGIHRKGPSFAKSNGLAAVGGGLRSEAVLSLCITASA